MTAFTSIPKHLKREINDYISHNTITLIEIEHLSNSLSKEHNIPLHEISHYIYMVYCIHLEHINQAPTYAQYSSPKDTY